MQYVQHYVIITSCLLPHSCTRLHSAHHTPNNLFSNSPLGLSPHSQPGSQSPDRRFSNSSFPGRGSPLQQVARASSPHSPPPPPGADCPHPTRMNSLVQHSLPPSSSSSLNPSGTDSPGGYVLPTQSQSSTLAASPEPPMPFQRASSHQNVLFVGDKKSSNQRRNTFSAEERIRLSLRVSMWHLYNRRVRLFMCMHLLFCKNFRARFTSSKFTHGT